MKYYQVVPSILIVLQILSAVAYATNEDWRRVVYWLAAAALTWSVTW